MDLAADVTIYCRAGDSRQTLKFAAKQHFLVNTACSCAQKRAIDSAIVPPWPALVRDAASRSATQLSKENISFNC
jgi:hypothetical protein